MKSFKSAALLLLLLGCAAPKLTPVKVKEGEEWLKTLSMSRAGFQTVRAEARVEVKRGFRKAKFHASILAVHPDKLYIEASGFGFPAALLSVEGNKTLVYLPAERRAYDSNDSSAVGSLLGVPLTSREWVSLLLGYAPNTPEKVEASSTVKGKLLVTVRDSDRTGVITIERKSGTLLSYEESRPRSLRYSYEDMIETVAGRYASHVRVVSEKLSVDFRFKEVQANPSIPSRLLDIDLPPGIDPLPLDKTELWPQ